MENSDTRREVGIPTERPRTEWRMLMRGIEPASIAWHTKRDFPLSQAPAKVRCVGGKMRIIKLQQSLFHTQMILERPATAATNRPPRPGAGRAETHKNAHSARADAGSIRPSALDQENEDAQSSVRSCQISCGQFCVPRQWQYRQNTCSPVHQTPLCGGWDCPCSLSVVACRSLLG